MYRGPLNPYIVLGKYNRQPVDEEEYTIDYKYNTVRNRQEYSVFRHGLGSALILGTSIFGLGLMAFYHDRDIINNISYIKAIQANNLYTERSFMLPGRRSSFKRAKTGVTEQYNANMRLLDVQLKKDKNLKPIAEYTQFPIDSSGNRQTLYTRIKTAEAAQTLLDEVYDDVNILPSDTSPKVAKMQATRKGNVFIDSIRPKNYIAGVNENEVKMAAEKVVNKIGSTFRDTTGISDAKFDAVISDAGKDGYQVSVNMKRRRGVSRDVIRFFFPKVSEGKYGEYNIDFHGQTRYVPLDVMSIKGTKASGSNVPKTFYDFFSNKATTLMSKDAADFVREVAGTGLNTQSGMSTFFYEVNRNLNSVFGFLLEKQKNLEFMPRASLETTPLLDYYTRKSLSFNNMFDMVRRNRMEVLGRSALNALYKTDMPSTQKARLKHDLNKIISDITTASYNRKDYDQYVNMLKDIYKNLDENGDAIINVQDSLTGRTVSVPMDVVLSSLNSSIKGTMSTGYGAIFDLIGFTNASSYQKNLRQFLLASKISKQMAEDGTGFKMDRSRFGLITRFEGTGGKGVTDMMKKLGDYGKEMRDVQLLMDDSAVLKMKSAVLFRKDILPDGSAFILQRPMDGTKEYSLPVRSDKIKGVRKKKISRMKVKVPMIYDPIESRHIKILSNVKPELRHYGDEGDIALDDVRIKEISDESFGAKLDDEFTAVKKTNEIKKFDLKKQVRQKTQRARELKDELKRLNNVTRTKVDKVQVISAEISAIGDEISDIRKQIHKINTDEKYLSKYTDDLKKAILDEDFAQARDIIRKNKKVVEPKKVYDMLRKSNIYNMITGQKPKDTIPMVQIEAETNSVLKAIDNLGNKFVAGRMYTDSGSSQYLQTLFGNNMILSAIPEKTEILIGSNFKTILAQASPFMKSYLVGASELAIQESKGMVDVLDEIISMYSTTKDKYISAKDLQKAKQVILNNLDFNVDDMTLVLKNIDNNRSIRGLNDNLQKFGQALAKKVNTLVQNGEMPDNDSILRRMLLTAKDVKSGKEVPIGFQNLTEEVSFVNVPLERAFGVNQTYDMFRPWSPFPSKKVGAKFNLYSLANIMYRGQTGLYDEIVSQYLYKMEETGFAGMARMTLPLSEGHILDKLNTISSGKSLSGTIKGQPINRKAFIQSMTSHLKSMLNNTYQKADSMNTMGVILEEALESAPNNPDVIPKLVNKMGSLVKTDKINDFVKSLQNYHNFVKSSMETFTGQGGDLHKEFANLRVMRFESINSSVNDLSGFLKNSGLLDDVTANSQIKSQFSYLANMSNQINRTLQDVPVLQGMVKRADVDKGFALLLPDKLDESLIRNLIQSDVAEYGRKSRIKGQFLNTYLHGTTAYLLYSERIASIKNKIQYIKENSGNPQAVENMMLDLNRDVEQLSHLAPEISESVTRLVDSTLDMAEGKRKMFSTRVTLPSIQGPVRPLEVMSADLAAKVNQRTEKSVLGLLTEAGIKNKDDINKVMSHLKTDLSTNIYNDYNNVMKSRGIVSNALFLTSKSMRKYLEKVDYVKAALENIKTSNANGLKFWDIISQNAYAFGTREPSITTGASANGVLTIIDEYKILKGMYETILGTPEVTDETKKAFNVIRNRLNQLKEGVRGGVEGKAQGVLASINKAMDYISEIGISDINTVTKLDYDGDLLQALIYMDKRIPVKMVQDELANLGKESNFTKLGSNKKDFVGYLKGELSKLDLDRFDNRDIQRFEKIMLEMGDGLDEYYLKENMPFAAAILQGQKAMAAGEKLPVIESMINGGKGMESVVAGTKLDNMVLKYGDELEFVNIELGKKYGSYMEAKDLFDTTKSSELGIYADALNVSKAERKEIIKQIAQRRGITEEEASKFQMFVMKPKGDKSIQKIRNKMTTAIREQMFMDDLEMGRVIKMDKARTLRLDKFFQGQAQKVDLPKAFPAAQKVQMLLQDYDHLKAFNNKVNESIKPSTGSYLLSGDDIVRIAEKTEGIVQAGKSHGLKKGTTSVLREWAGELQQVILNTKHKSVMSVGEGVKEAFDDISKGKASPEDIKSIIKGDFNISRTYAEGLLSEAGIATNTIGDRKSKFRLSQIEQILRDAKNERAAQIADDLRQYRDDISYTKFSRENFPATMRHQHLTTPASIADDAANVLNTINTTMGTKIANEVASGGRTRSVTLGDTFTRMYSYVTNRGHQPGVYNQDELSRIYRIQGTTIPSTFFPIVHAVDKILPNMGDIVMNSIDQKDQLAKSLYVNRPGTVKNMVRILENRAGDSFAGAILNSIGNSIPDKKDYSLLNRSSTSKLGTAALIGAGFLIAQALHPSPTMDFDGIMAGSGTNAFELKAKESEYKRKDKARKYKVRIMSENILDKEYQYTDLAQRYFS